MGDLCVGSCRHLWQRGEGEGTWTRQHSAARTASLDVLAGGGDLDVLVVGGGVVGAGAALDAVTRGSAPGWWKPGIGPAARRHGRAS